MTEPMTTADKIAAIETSGFQLAWDGCHKIYFLEDEGRVKQATGYGYTLYPAAELSELIGSSCFLVFVSRWGYDNDDFDHRWNIRQGTEDIYTAAERHLDADLADGSAVLELADKPPTSVRTDSETLDLIATMMRDNDWNADLTTNIADVIGEVRPHPGDPDHQPKPPTDVVEHVCGCGYRMIFVYDDPNEGETLIETEPTPDQLANGHWEHDAAPYFWGDDHTAGP